MASKTHFIVGSRKSKLAMVQTHWVIDNLKKAYPDYTFTIHEYDTQGDQILDVALSKIGDKGLFTQELEQGLLNQKIDFAVHSLKDLQTNLVDGLMIGCITERLAPSDVVLMRSDLVAQGITNLDQLDGQVIGTSSLRRMAQLKKRYPNLQYQDCRGNLQTRIQKLERGDFAAIILARAGLERQGTEYLDKITQTINEQDMYYAVGQGALGIECRSDDEVTIKLLSVLHHLPTFYRCSAERAFMRKLEGGCHAPIGVLTTIEANALTLHGRVLSLDGKTSLEATVSGPTSEAETLGSILGQRLLQSGAEKLLKN